MSNENLLQEFVEFTQPYGEGAYETTKALMKRFVDCKGISLEPKTPVKLPDELLDRRSIKNMPIGFSAYTVPWAMVMLEGGELWITESFSITQQEFGTSSMRIRRVDGGVLVDRQTVRPMRYEASTQTTNGLLPVLGFFNDEPRRGVRW